MTGRRLAAAALALGMVVGPALPAAAQSDDLQVDVRGSTFDPDGATELIVNVSGPAKPDVLDADAFRVLEAGEPIDGVEVAPLLESEGRIVTVLSIDASRSMTGEPLEEVRSAAIDLVGTLSDLDIELGLHVWSTEPEQLSAPTTDADALVDAIESIEALEFTALFDAVIFGIEELEAVEGDAVRSLVLLADGEDNASDATMEEAIAAANDAEIPITVVAFETNVLDFSALRPLADETNGRFLMATQTGEIDEVFAEVAADVASQYVLSYDSSTVDPADLDVAVQVDTGEVLATTEFVVANPRTTAAVEDVPVPAAVAPFDAGLLGTQAALVAMLALAFVAALLFLMPILLPRGNPAVTRTLRRGITLVTRAPAGTPRTSGISASTLGRMALEAVEALPTPEGYDERLQDRIDRAGWQLRGSEFNAIRIASAAAVGAWLWALSGNLLLGLVGVILGAVGPTVVLANAKQKRHDRFMELLPDTLQLLSGTLRAGYGVLQAIDTVVKESEAPMSTEFQRVLTEARLGLPLEDSLASMADRVGNDDFRWVVVAMNIQRRVGGNLAELLETIAGTLRGRDQVRRQVKVLSAEGRLSAIVLIALPFAIIAYLLVANPAYLMTLFVEPLGIAMVVGSGLLMVVGVFWMRRLIRIDV